MSSFEPRYHETQAAPKDGTSGEYTGDRKHKSAGAGRLSSLVTSSLAPSLGRMAGAAAQVSQEAARAEPVEVESPDDVAFVSMGVLAPDPYSRYTFDHAKRYSMKKQWKNRAGRAPPGQDDPSASLDWSGVGDRFSSLSWYEHQLVGHVPGDASGSNAANHQRSKHDRNDVGDLSTIATLEQVDEWIKGPIYDDDSNVIDGLGALDIHGSDPEGVADVQDEPSPTEDRRDTLESFKSPEGVPETQGYPTEEVGASGTAEKHSSSSVDTASSVSSNLKPMFRKSAGLVSTLVRKSKAAAITVYNEKANGKGPSGSEDARGNAGADDPIPSIDAANPESIGPEQLGRLKREASAGNKRAQSQLRQVFGPPRSAMKGSCEACGEPFSMSRYRHHCKRCGGSFCLKHAGQAHPMPRMSLPRPQRVCSPCEHALETEDWRELVDWRLERIDAYLEGRLIEYFDDHVDTKKDKAWRVMDGAIYVGKVAPIGSTLKVSLQVMDAFRKYGVTGVSALVLRKEFVEAVNALRSICGVDTNSAKSVHETSAAMFYMMAERRAQRGNHPDGEHEAHRAFPSLSNEELSFFHRLAAVGLVFPTLPTIELQILCNITEWSLIFHREESALHRPSFALVASRATATAVLTVRGTKNIEDVLTDVQTQQVPFPSGRKKATSQGEYRNGGSERTTGVGISSASAGMARAAEWLYREVVHSLVKLRRAGHKILIMGHSLGAGVAVLLGLLVQEAIPDVRVVAFATPAIVSLELSKECEDICTSIILHDDIVPRVTPRAVRKMMNEAKSTKEFWAKHLQDDMDAVVDRAKGLWAPRMRGTTSTSSSTGSADSAFVGDAGDPGTKKAENVDGGYSGTDKDPELVRGPPGTPTQPNSRVPPPLPPRGTDTDFTHAGSVGNGVPSEGSPFGNKDASEGGDAREPGSGSFDAGGDGVDLLPDLFVPGRIVHIYSQRGVYRASDIPRDHQCLREFPMYGNIISDHHNKSYYVALKEVMAVRKAEARGAVVPEWVPFSACNECQLCKADFFWASTLRSEAQRARDKHNCRMCGILVCHACSDHQEPLPQYGVVDPSRVCSRCFYGTEDLRLP